MDLNGHTALYWRNMHVVLLFVFPLLAVGPYILLKPAGRWLRWMANILLYGFVFLYTALDLLNGVGAAHVYRETSSMTMVTHHGVYSVMGSKDSIVAILGIGNKLGNIGVWLYLVVCMLVAGWYVRRYFASQSRWAVLAGGGLLVAASISFLDSHIYWPRGVCTMIAFAIAFALLGRATSVTKVN